MIRYGKPVKILKRYINIFFVDIRFWKKDLEIMYYKDHMGGSRIEDI